MKVFLTLAILIFSTFAFSYEDHVQYESGYYYVIIKKEKFDRVNAELIEQINEGLEMTALVKSHILSCAAVVGVRDPEDIAEDILKNVKMGMEKNYDHITLRILTAFIPVLFSIGKGTLARGLVRSAIYTSRTERNRYMYEWFSLYDRVIRGRTEGLEERIKIFAGRKYVIHEVIARRVAYRLGVNPEEDLEV